MFSNDDPTEDIELHLNSQISFRSGGVSFTLEDLLQMIEEEPEPEKT